jgi:hypothetical protein
MERSGHTRPVLLDDIVEAPSTDDASFVRLVGHSQASGIHPQKPPLLVELVNAAGRVLD